MSSIPEPTHEQCNAKAAIALPDGRTGYACWYPQMGGYTSVCIVVPDEDGCVDAYVWHDGDFPFSEDPEYRPVTNPRKLHHSCGDQFIEFGRFMNEIAG